MEQGEDGKNMLTNAYVVSVCEHNGQYTTPRANTQLFLHYKGKLAFLLSICANDLTAF